MNINEWARRHQQKHLVIILVVVGIITMIAWLCLSHKKSPKPVESVKLTGVIDTQFKQDATQEALAQQQQQIKELNGLLNGISAQLETLQNSQADSSAEDIPDQTIVDLQNRIAALETKKETIEPQVSETLGITTTSFAYTDKDTNYIPAGTFAQAVLLNGADANAGVHGQTDTTPIVLRILDSGTLPNGKHASLKGCFVTAAVYGDASSERGQIRLQRLSCAENNIIDVAVEGTVNDMGGSDGIRGNVVMRNNKLIWNAGVSGAISGIGNALQQHATTQTVSPLGVTNAIQPGKTLQSSALGGASTALSKLADYYIKLADMYHPIVQIHAGSLVNIVFLKGFSLTEGVKEIKTESKSEPMIPGDNQ